MAKSKDQKRMEARDRMVARLLEVHAQRETASTLPPRRRTRMSAHVVQESRHTTLTTEHTTLCSQLQTLNVACGLPPFTLTRDNTWTMGQKDFTFRRNAHVHGEH